MLYTLMFSKQYKVSTAFVRRLGSWQTKQNKAFQDRLEFSRLGSWHTKQNEVVQNRLVFRNQFFVRVPQTTAGSMLYTLMFSKQYKLFTAFILVFSNKGNELLYTFLVVGNNTKLNFCKN